MKHATVKSLIIFFTLLCLCSCMNSGMSDTQFLKYLRESGLSRPDSLKTDEQLLLKQKLIHIYATQLEAVGDILVLKADKIYFIQNGLPAYCYDMVVYDINNTNQFIQEFNTGHEPGNAVNATTIIQQYQNLYYELTIK